MGVLCTSVKLLTDLQILRCELHKNAFGGRARPGPRDPLAVVRRREGEGRDGKGEEGFTVA